LRKCAFCMEWIQDQAIVCRFCNRDQPPAPKAEPKGIRKYLALIIPAVIVGPFIVFWLGAAVVDALSPAHREDKAIKRQADDRAAAQRKERDIQECAEEGRRTRMTAEAQLVASVACMKSRGYPGY
jgi:hypothetical protein